MSVIHPDSLAATVDAVNEAFFLDRKLSKAERQKAARWIAGRQGLPGSYRGALFAPTEQESGEPLVLFTGEKVVSGGGAAHILGQEAGRVLLLLDGNVPAARKALARAWEGMTQVLAKAVTGHSWRQSPGEYCCARCTCAVWRHMAVGGLAEGDPERWLSAGMKALRKHRAGNGRWRRFPFYYTLLAMSDLDLRPAVAEMRYAAKACEKLLARKEGGDPVEARRRRLAERVLARC